MPQIVVWVNDFLVHVATREPCQRALLLVTNHPVNIGLLAQKKEDKGTSPAKEILRICLQLSG